MKKQFREIIERFYLVFVLALVILIFAVAANNFFTLNNLTNIFVQNSFLIIASIGISMIMISGGADMSVSYQMGLVSVILGILLTEMNCSVPLAIIIGLAVGALLGVINGLITIKLNVHPMVATLATMTIYQGAAYIISGSKSYFDFPASFKAIGQRYIGFVPICVIIMLVMVVLAYIMLNKTYFGRYIYALGGNSEAARLAGVNIQLVRVLAFVIAGLFVAVATIVVTARAGSGSVTISADAVFSCFTACVLGGVSFKGGGGNIIGVALGVLILGVLGNGMQMVGLSIYHQYIVKGILLVLAIAYDNFQKEARLKES